MDHRPRRNILLVEDDPDLREALADVLADTGRAVIQAVDGVDALAKLNELDGPCLVLLDAIMPGADGVAFLEQLRQHGHAEEFPVVLMSGHPDLRGAEKYPSVVGTLRKPFEVDELFALVNGHS